MNKPGKRTPEHTTGNEFNQLLSLFDPNPDKAAEKYEILRLKIASFLRWNGVVAAEEYADVVFDRLLEQLRSGAVIHNAASYLFVTARHLLREIHSGRRRLETVLNDPTYQAPSFEPSYEMEQEESTLYQRKQDCLKTCLHKLSEAECRLILSYYRESREPNKVRRKNIAQKLGIDQNALRLRVHRIRLKLSRCVNRCTEQAKSKEIRNRTFALIKRSE